MNGVIYSAGETVIITEDTVITAVWINPNASITAYTINFRANGGSGTMDTVSLYAAEYVLPACQFTAPRNTGGNVMVFAGWRVNDIQTVLPAGTLIPIAGDTVLTAVWTEKTLTTYTVFFDANGGSGTYGPVHRKAGTYTLPKCYFTPPAGKQFKAWETGGRQYAPGEIIFVVSDTSIKAVWVDVYIVVFHANGGEGSMAPQAVPKGTYTLPECEFTAPEGTKFKAWMRKVARQTTS